MQSQVVVRIASQLNAARGYLAGLEDTAEPVVVLLGLEERILPSKIKALRGARARHCAAIDPTLGLDDLGQRDRDGHVGLRERKLPVGVRVKLVHGDARTGVGHRRL